MGFEQSSPPGKGREQQARSGQAPEVVDKHRDISAALRHSEARLRQITDAIPAHIAYFDHAWIFRYGNRRYAEWFGTSSERMADRSMLEVIGREVFDKVEEHVQRALGGEEVSYEYTMTSTKGEVLHARSTLVPDVGPDGEVMGCFVHAVDVTEQRRTYSALAQAQKMEAIGQLTGGLAHDFNNMLTVMMGNLGGLREALGDHPAVVEFVEPALAAAEGGAELIRRLLAFSRQQPIAPVAVEVGELVLRLTRLIRRSIPITISIVSAGHEGDLVALADPHQLEGALLNLALNARDAMPNGGELRIACTQEELVGVAAAELELVPGCYVQIAVSDNGTGMDGATLAHMFEPFFTTKTFGRGSGLGLAMVYGFIKQSGGGVRIRSRQAVGTTVALLLPCARATLPRSANVRASLPASVSPVSLEGRLVLLVDDDDKVRDAVRKQLAALGCAILEAENGQEAADMVENIAAIELVLSDIVMPSGMDGRTLARFVRRFRPTLPVVLMSGFADRSAAGCEGDVLQVLAKPFSQEVLGDALREAMA